MKVELAFATHSGETSLNPSLKERIERIAVENPDNQIFLMLENAYLDSETKARFEQMTAEGITATQAWLMCSGETEIEDLSEEEIEFHSLFDPYIRTLHEIDGLSSKYTQSGKSRIQVIFEGDYERDESFDFQANYNLWMTELKNGLFYKAYYIFKEGCTKMAKRNQLREDSTLNKIQKIIQNPNNIVIANFGMGHTNLYHSLHKGYGKQVSRTFLLQENELPIFDPISVMIRRVMQFGEQEYLTWKRALISSFLYDLSTRDTHAEETITNNSGMIQQAVSKLTEEEMNNFEFTLNDKGYEAALKYLMGIS